MREVMSSKTRWVNVLQNGHFSPSSLSVSLHIGSERVTSHTLQCRIDRYLGTPNSRCLLFAPGLWDKSGRGSTIKLLWVHTVTSRYPTWYDLGCCQDIKHWLPTGRWLLGLVGQPLSIGDCSPTGYRWSIGVGSCEILCVAWRVLSWLWLLLSTQMLQQEEDAAQIFFPLTCRERRSQRDTSECVRGSPEG